MAKRKGAKREDKGAAPVSTFLPALAGSLTSGVLLALLVGQGRPGPVAIVSMLLVAGVAVMTVYYWTVFGYGAAAPGSQQRERYELLRSRLDAGGRIGPAYERMLAATLDAVDRFFGDKDRPGRGRLAGLFGLRAPAPLWTAPAYDRCLVIALIYPIATILIIWAASGHVGPAEAALQLPADAAAWQRGLALLGLAAGGVTMWAAGRAQRSWLRPLGIAMGMIALTVAVLLIGPVVPLIALVIIGVIASGEEEEGGLAALALSVLLTLAIGATGDPTGSFASKFLSIAIVSGVTGGALLLSIWLLRGGARYTFLTLGIFLIATIAPVWLSRSADWPTAGPMLLFLTLLMVVNAPFDWGTLGLTRGLLRRGLERGGWWPLAYGLIDLFAAALVVVALSVAVLLAVQLFGHFTARGGGAQVLDPGRVLEALADPARRAAPEYWWLYAMLLSTLIPSIVNVALGALSLLRGIPGMHARLGRRMPEGEAVIESERMWMAPLLAAQAMLSVAIGTAVMLGLLWLILAWELPLMGWNLVSVLQALAAADLPGRLLGLLGLG